MANTTAVPVARMKNDAFPFGGTVSAPARTSATQFLVSFGLVRVNKEKAARYSRAASEDFTMQVCRGADASPEIYEGPQPPEAEFGSAAEPTPIATGCETMPL